MRGKLLVVVGLCWQIETLLTNAYEWRKWARHYRSHRCVEHLIKLSGELSITLLISHLNGGCIITEVLVLVEGDNISMRHSF